MLILPTLTRALVLVALTLLAGGFAFNLLVLRSDKTAVLRKATTQRRRNWLALMLALAGAAILLDSLRVFGVDDVSVRLAVLFFVRVAIFFVLVFGLHREWDDSPLAVACTAALLLTQSFFAHAGREPQWLLPVMADWLHFVFVAIWIGGVAYFAVVLAPAVLRQRSLVKEMGVAIGKFSPLAMMSVLAIAITGIIQGTVFVGSVEALIGSDYGRALLIKVMAFAALIGFGAFHQFVIGPKLNAWRAKAESQEQAAVRFGTSIAIEAVVSLLPLIAAAAMTVLPLARDMF